MSVGHAEVVGYWRDSVIFFTVRCFWAISRRWDSFSALFLVCRCREERGASELNQLNGAYVPDEVQNAMDQAETLLTKVGQIYSRVPGNFRGDGIRFRRPSSFCPILLSRPAIVAPGYALP